MLMPWTQQNGRYAMQDRNTEMRVINDYDDLMEFLQLQRQCVEQGNETFLYDGQYYSAELAESIITGHLNKGVGDGGKQ